MKKPKSSRTITKHETWTARPGRSDFSVWIEWDVIERIGDRDARVTQALHADDVHPKDRAQFEAIIWIGDNIRSQLQCIVEQHLARKAHKRAT